jgi:metal-dependent amidase/aminoacylase/carboxypeptidase family protein
MDLKDKIKAKIEAHYNEIVANRRHIHQHPELSFEEVETAKYISQKLHALPN